MRFTAFLPDLFNPKTRLLLATMIRNYGQPVILPPD
jgi:hypothetical protein